MNSPSEKIATTGGSCLMRNGKNNPHLQMDISFAISTLVIVEEMASAQVGAA